MGIFSFLKRLFSSSPVSDQSAPSANLNTPTNKLTFSQKELIAVQRTTLADVQKLSNFPFYWNTQLKKSIQPHGHPFVYMDIVRDNLSAATSELGKMNTHIENSKRLCDVIPKTLCIPTNEIVFKPSSYSGYTRLILSPITHDGSPAPLPVTLSFMTDMDRSETTHGDIYYGTSGSIQKASLYFWRRGVGYFLYYDTVDNELVLSRVEDGLRNIIYKGKHLLEHEADLIKTEKDFAWLQNNLPAQCPKSITSYRRMRTQNTKNFQKLKALASEMGRTL